MLTQSSKRWRLLPYWLLSTINRARLVLKTVKLKPGATMAHRKSFRLSATVVASFVLAAAVLTGCGGGGGAPAADPVPTSTIQSTKTTISVVVTANGLAVEVNTETTSAEGAKSSVATASGTATVAGIAGYKVASGFVIDGTTGKQFLLRPDVETDVSVSTVVGTTTVAGSAKLIGHCATHTENVGGKCLYAAKAFVGNSGFDKGAIFYMEMVDASLNVFKRVDMDGKGNNLPLALSCVQSSYRYEGVRVSCKLTTQAIVTYEFAIDGSSKVIDNGYVEAEHSPTYLFPVDNLNCDSGKGFLMNDGKTCLTHNGFDFIASIAGKSLTLPSMYTAWVYGAQ